MPARLPARQHGVKPAPIWRRYREGWLSKPAGRSLFSSGHVGFCLDLCRAVPRTVGLVKNGGFPDWISRMVGIHRRFPGAQPALAAWVVQPGGMAGEAAQQCSAIFKPRDLGPV